MQTVILRMMSILSTIFMLNSSATAIQLYGTSVNKAPSTPAPSRIESPDEFSSKVNTLSQQTNANLAQQVNNMLPKQPIKPGSGNLIPAHVPSSTPSNTITTTPSNASVSSYGTTSTSPNPSSKNQPYTGFGTINNNTINNKPAASGTPNWNIKY